MDLRVLTLLLLLLWSYGYGAITTTYRNYDTRKHPFMIELDIPESKITCTNDTNPSAIRCIIKNAIIFAGEVYIIADTGIIIPKILCSAVDVGHSISCRFYIVSRYNMFQLLKKHVKDKRKSIVGIKTESAIYFAGVNGENTYHSLFEEMIPIFEIIQSDRILSKWLDKNDNNIKLAHLYDNSHFSDSYASKFFQTFFPNIDYSFGKFDPYNSFHTGKKKLNTRIYVIDHLVVGSNHSCVHYYGCSRDSFQNPFITGEFRDYILNKIGINNTYRNLYNIINENNTISIISKNMKKLNKKPSVVIIQRRNSRIIENIQQISLIIKNIINILPKIIYYEDLSIDEQIKTTYVTDILIMVHGGAVGNAIFLPPYATLIDIYPYTFPFHLNGLVNWIRYALKDIPIAHASFDIINPNHMIFINNFTLPLCSHDKSKRKIESAFTLFWLVERVFIDPERFQSHFRNVFKNWRSRTNYVPPMTKYDFKQYSTSYKEPWYFRYIKKSNPNKNISLPSCISIINTMNISQATYNRTLLMNEKTLLINNNTNHNYSNNKNKRNINNINDNNNNSNNNISMNVDHTTTTTTTTTAAVTGWIRFNLTVEDIISFENCSESSLLDFNSSSSIQNELSFASEKTFIENRFPIQSNNNNYNSYMNTHQQGTMTMTMISTMTMTFPPIEDDILHRSVTLYEQGMVKEAVSVLDNSTLYTGPGGVLWNPHLENHIQNISKYHLQPSVGSGIIDRSSGISDISGRSPRRVGYQRPVQVNKILHVVTSLYNVGGHTRVLMSFIEFLSSKSHHIYFTRRLTIHSPSFIYKTISKKNITACKVPDLGCADRLRRMSRSFDLVVLHVHTHDVIPVLAFGTGYKGPQIALFDHADHLGWVGSSVIDVRLVYRQAALRLSSLRGIQWSRNMLMPLPAGDPFMKSNKTTAREQLGFRDNQIVILTMAGKYKYGNTFFFPDIITNILKEFPSVYFIGVGVPDQWKKRFTASRAKTSQWKLLPKGLPGTQAAVYHTAADIHLDSFPFSSITSMLESVLDGGVAISFCPWTSLSHLILCAEAADYGEVLTPLMPNPVLSCRTQDAFLKALRTLIQRPQTLRSLQNLTTQSMRRHTGQGWATAMEGIFDSVLKLPERSPWQIKPIDWTYEI